MKVGKRFRKAMIKLLKKRVYIWELRFIKYEHDFPVVRFIQGHFVDHYWDKETKEKVYLNDNFIGIYQHQIYGKLSKMSNQEAFFKAREIAKSNNYFMDIAYYMKELR